MYTVYKHTAPNGKVYIGITSQKPEKRWENGHKYKDSPHFYHAIRKYGWENFKHEILIDGLPKEQACDLEIKLISEYHARDPRYGYNILIGGDCGALGVHRSAETRRKISEARKGTPCPMKGKHHTAEARRKMSKAHKGKPSTWKGKHPSPESRKKMSESHKGAYPSLETRRKMSEAHKGANHPNYGKHLSAETRRKLSEAHKGNIPRNAKAVICVETGIMYSSCTEAGKSVGVTHASVSSVARGITKTAGGYHWKYAEDMEETK